MTDPQKCPIAPGGGHRSSFSLGQGSLSFNGDLWVNECAWCGYAIVRTAETRWRIYLITEQP